MLLLYVLPLSALTELHSFGLTEEKLNTGFHKGLLTSLMPKPMNSLGMRLRVHDLAVTLGVRLPHSTVVARLCFGCKTFCMQGFLHPVLNIPKFLNWKPPSC